MAEGKGRRRRKAPTSGTAPSAADIDSLEKMEPSEEATAHKPSDVDAMGQDKRRQVIGHTYGPSRRSQVVFVASVAAVIVLVVGGYMAAIAAFDQPKDEYPDRAPWSASGAPQNAAGNHHPPSPSGPCGEPGNPYPQPADSPCAGRKSTDEVPAQP
ncbi:MAG TPA: hypothetical protein VHH72_03885 [Solirubrobacterales bacterium]|jgi:hypothetical protein|nr:hypothetical protein [Solirubrobacterales bacterium]